MYKSKSFKGADSSSEITYSKILIFCDRSYKRELGLANADVKDLTAYLRCT